MIGALVLSGAAAAAVYSLVRDSARVVEEVGAIWRRLIETIE